MINKSFLGFGSLVMAGYSALVFGLGLSEVELKSGLNQELDARIWLLSATQAELDSLSVSVIMPELAQRATTLKHELLQDEAGSYIRVTSADPIREPVLSFSVAVGWSGGQITRAYSLIVDPAK